MNSDRINRWLTLFANFGVVIGILLLIFELNQNRDLMKAQIRHQISQEEANYALTMANNRNLVELILRAGQGEELDRVDSLQNFLRLNAFFRMQENTHYQARQGLFDELEYEGIKQARRGFVNVSPATAIAWCQMRKGMSAVFRADMDAAFNELNCENVRRIGERVDERSREWSVMTTDGCPFVAGSSGSARQPARLRPSANRKFEKS